MNGKTPWPKLKFVEYLIPIRPDVSEILSYPHSTLNVSRYDKGQKLGEIWGYKINGLARTEEQMKDHLASPPHEGQDALGANWAKSIIS